jgi:N-acetylmuramoyl-L-alanine amidase
MKIAFSSGHGKYIRGASGYLDEVDEARKIVEAVAELWRANDVEVTTIHDNQSTSQNANLAWLVDQHNRLSRDLDVSCHLNAYQTTSKPMGSEVWYYSQSELAGRVSAAMAGALDLPNRGGKYTSGLTWVMGCEKPSILLEVCFVDSSTDADHYHAYFDEVVTAIAESIAGIEMGEAPVEPEEPPPVEPEEPTGENRLEITATGAGNLMVDFNGNTVIVGDGNPDNRVDITMALHGDVVVSVNGQEFHNFTPPPDEIQPNHRDVMASVFGGSSDPNNSAYPPYDFLGDSDFYVALPVNVSDEAVRQRGVRVYNRATGESEIGRIRDKGPWMVDDTSYCFGDAEAISVTCYRDHEPLPRGPNQGKIPSNEAAIDLSPALAHAIGIDGLGRVDWEFVEGETV